MPSCTSRNRAAWTCLPSVYSRPKQFWTRFMAFAGKTAVTSTADAPTLRAHPLASLHRHRQSFHMDKPVQGSVSQTRQRKPASRHWTTHRKHPQTSNQTEPTLTVFKTQLYVTRSGFSCLFSCLLPIKHGHAGRGPRSGKIPLGWAFFQLTFLFLML